MELPTLPDDVDIRFLLPMGAAFDGLRARLETAGVPYRSVAHWVEDEIISTVGDDGVFHGLSVTTRLTSRSGVDNGWHTPVSDLPAYDARDAFAGTWDAHDVTVLRQETAFVPTAGLVPAQWLDYLPFDRFNPAQAQAAPAVLDTSDHLVITAPTGAGKTVVGMLAVLRTILGEGRKAAWLVPQRSLTDELDRELETWRGLGLRVERLSGEYSVDLDKVREADLWIATTEKFEAVCRASSLQTALADVGCLVIDEIHLLGSAVRGPLLEALLARVRGAASPVRIVGLSATVSNAAEIAEWLDGRLVATAWRPSRLTWQLPMIPAYSDRAADSTARTRITVELARSATDGDGSVLVFCGSKPNVRTTALALAADRGANTAGIASDDIDRLHEVCASVGIGLHYKDWEFKREAEARFRSREWNVLVATSTVAAGVNLPARAVIIRDTRIGLDNLDVATVLQMFGRAGRIGAGEHEGWGYLITNELERPAWQGALVDGYTVYSQIHDSIADHVLAEVLQGRITSVQDAEQWWLHTLSHHQGDDDVEPVVEAIDFLLDNGFLAEDTRTDGTPGVAVTDLGRLTARFMVDTSTAADVLTVLSQLPVPGDPDAAEEILAQVIAVAVPELAAAPIAENHRAVVAAVLKARGYRTRINSSTRVGGLGSAMALSPGDLARAAILLVANSPELFTRPARVVAGLPNSLLFPVLEQAPRYLAWLAAQGHLASVHPWVAIVAGDLGRRIRWRRCGPRRGSGRLLWMLENMATPAHATEVVPRLWAAVGARGITAPDWPHTAPPHDCRLDSGEYTMLLRERVTHCALDAGGDRVTAADPVSGTLTAWTGSATTNATIEGLTTVVYPKADDNDDAVRGAAIFTRRGDHKAIGWLARYRATDAT
ncbi:DEAD/DEAH box helicase [Saccharothrix deserti]|uniref:DEAD/DEAH box helicase n=1 Tax=Saccharothrix deserti TaxID=2593674 RepID=UPI001EE3B002|nr:DEAD/DEAH box helicase [Saccharothrix deserti]